MTSMTTNLNQLHQNHRPRPASSWEPPDRLLDSPGDDLKRSTRQHAGTLRLGRNRATRHRHTAHRETVPAGHMTPWARRSATVRTSTQPRCASSVRGHRRVTLRPSARQAPPPSKNSAKPRRSPQLARLALAAPPRGVVAVGGGPPACDSRLASQHLVAGVAASVGLLKRHRPGTYDRLKTKKQDYLQKCSD